MKVDGLPAEASDQTTSTIRDARLEEIVACLLAEESSSGLLSDDEVRRRHPDLAEPLLAALRDARAIAAIAKKARAEGERREAAPGNAADSDEATLLQRAIRGYDILQEIGRGGQGVVYRAVQKSTGQDVAIKLLLDARAGSASHRRRFERELDILRELNDPHFVKLLDAGIVLGRPYFVMEYVSGLPIDQHLARHKATLRERVALFIRVCRAMGAAHQRGYIHRDLKPGNIFVNPAGEPIILDLGLAKALDDPQEAPDRSMVTLPQQVVGTMPFLSPEQAGGDMRMVDTQSDVYSLGVVLYLLIAGELPYPIKGDLKTDSVTIAETRPRSFRKALAGASKRDLPPDDLEQVVCKALAKEKRRRYDSANALADDLQRFLDGEAVDAKRDSTFYVLRKTLWRYRVPTSIAAAFVLLLAGALIVTIGMYRRENRLARTFQSALTMDAALRQGIIEYNEGYRERAEEALNQVLEIAKLVPSDDDIMASLVFRAHEMLAKSTRQLGKSGEFDRHMNAMFDVAEPRVRANPRSLIWRRNLATAHLWKGNNLIQRGRYTEALVSAEEYHKLNQCLAQEEPENVRLQSDFASSLGLLATCHVKLGDNELAGSYYRRSAELIERLLDANPTSSELTVALAAAEGNLGMWHYGQFTVDDHRIAKSVLVGAQARLEHLEKLGRIEARANRTNGIRRAIAKNLKLLDQLAGDPGKLAVKRRQRFKPTSTTQASDVAHISADLADQDAQDGP